MMGARMLLLLGVFSLMLAGAALADKALDYYQSGIRKYDKGNILGALADFDKAIEMRPNYANAYYGRGVVKKATGDLDGAITDLTKAIQIRPSDPSPYWVRGRAERAKHEL